MWNGDGVVNRQAKLLMASTLPNVFYRLWLAVYGRWAVRYVKKVRTWRWSGLRLTIPPGVFHPGLYFSTIRFLKFLEKIDFQEKKVLDVGAGSGILALFAAQKGAVATAIDINPQAVETTRANAKANGLTVEVLQSDLFASVPQQHFDVVLINPPYFRKDPVDAPELAFFAGKNLEYFQKLFVQLPGYCHHQTQIWMTVAVDANLEYIRRMAAEHHWALNDVRVLTKWGRSMVILQALQA